MCKYSMDYNKVKTSFVYQYNHAIFFQIIKNQDFDKSVTNIVEWQISYLKSIGFLVTPVLDLKDALTKCKAHGVKSFAYVKLDYLVDWFNSDLIRIINNNSKDGTVRGNENFFCCTPTEKIYKDLIFEEDLEHEQLTKDKIYNLIRHQRNLIPNFHTDKLIEIINKSNASIVWIPWEGTRTKYMLEKIKLKKRKIEIYSDRPIPHQDNKSIITNSNWNIFENIDVVKKYFSDNTQNCYFDFGSQFMQLDKCHLYNTEERVQKILNIYETVISKNKLNLCSGFFPWGIQYKLMQPAHKEWLYYPWNLKRF